MNPLDLRQPEQESLEAELKLIRREGITALGKLDLPELFQAARTWGRVESDEPVTSPVIERMLIDAALRMGDHDQADAARTSLGLNPEDRLESPSTLRRAAAELLHVSVDHYRKEYEPRLLGEIAHHLLAEIHTYRLRLSQLRLDVRTPVGSRLAVEWLTRFEAMYRIWTPISGIGNDLTAARSTLLEPEQMWDREPNPDVPGDAGHTQERQAMGYLRDAFAHYAEFLLQMKGFVSQFGGLWLLPDAQAETDLAGAAERVRLAAPTTAAEDSAMRTLLSCTHGHEHDLFLDSAIGDPVLGSTLADWEAWLAACPCFWPLGERVGREPFPTPGNNPGIEPGCGVHSMIAACGDYMLILDDAWDQIADWYHEVPQPRRHSRTSEEAYYRPDGLG